MTIPDETEADEDDSNIIVHTTAGYEKEILIKIMADGTIERGPHFTTTDQASLAFWETLAAVFPKFEAAMKARLREEIGRE